MKWTDRFMAMAELVSTWSKDPSTQVGAVIVSPCRRKLAVGYNGLPRGMEDTDTILGDRSQKYPRVLHAEVNAILNAQFSVEGCTLYCTLAPCQPCASVIMQAGLKEVIVPEIKPGPWCDGQFSARADLLAAGVIYGEVS